MTNRPVPPPLPPLVARQPDQSVVTTADYVTNATRHIYNRMTSTVVVTRVTTIPVIALTTITAAAAVTVRRRRRHTVLI